MNNTAPLAPVPPHAPVPTDNRTLLTPPNTFPPSLSTITPPRAPLRVAGYARVSTDLQREKESIRTQVELIEQFCAANGHTLVEVYCDDGVSVTTHLHQRPGGARLLADARAGKFGALVVYKADRIGRDTLVNETAVRALYDEGGIPFLGVAELIDLATPIGRAMFTFQSAIGRLERENTLQRSRDATLRLAREGAWLGGIVPFGYRVEGKERAARLVVADDHLAGVGMSEADAVRLIYRLAGEEGQSSIQIAAHLNKLGVPTAYRRDGREVSRGKRKEKTDAIWRPGRVRNLLVEPTYKGVHVWGKRSKTQKNGQGNAAAPKATVERAVPAIVDAGLWEAAHLTLRRNRLFRPDIEKRPYLLRGLMKCAGCGLTYVGTVSQGQRADLLSSEELSGAEVRGEMVLRPYYVCNGRSAQHQNYGETKARCSSGYVRAVELEALVWREIEGFLNEPESVLAELGVQLNTRAVNGDAVQRLKRLRGEQAQGDAERATLYRLFRRGAISERDLDAQLGELLAEEKALAGQIERLEREVAKSREAGEALDGARALLQTLRQKLEADGSWATRRRVVEALVAGVTVASHRDNLAPRGKGRTRCTSATGSRCPVLKTPRRAPPRRRLCRRA